jgi:transcriptional regulator with XRE-family HTH domain
MLRQQKGIKQNMLAQTCGISPTYLSQIENNVKEPNTSVLKTIADRLEVPLPIMFFLSIDRDDIAPEKQKAFEVLAPSVKSMINTFFSEDQKR